MRICLLGVDHRTAPVEVRERLVVRGEQLHEVLGELRRRFDDAECVVLSTCNRTELYLARPTRQPPGRDELREFLATRCGVDVETVTRASVWREQEAAVAHLFRVSAGLASMVLGEPQVLGQVKRAYEAAADADTVGPMLHQVFQEAIRAAKRVRTDSGIGAGRVSVASVAVDFARQIFEDFTDKTVVGVGAGDMAKATLRRLRDLAPHALWVLNRSRDRAAELAEELRLSSMHADKRAWKPRRDKDDGGGGRGGARAWEELDQLLVEADIVLTSTGSSEPILTTARFEPLMKRRRRRPLFIIDIAVPRDVAPTVGELPNVYLYNIDDLQSVVAANFDQRREEMTACETQLTEAAAACLRQVQNRDVGQLVRALRHRLHDIGDAEQMRTRRKLAAVIASNAACGPTTADGQRSQSSRELTRAVVDEPSTAPRMEANQHEVDALLEEHTRRVINKILHLPLSQLDHKNTDAPLGVYASALRRLFQLESDPSPDATHSRRPVDPESNGTG